jgi:hypothetical protein
VRLGVRVGARAREPEVDLPSRPLEAAVQAAHDAEAAEVPEDAAAGAWVPGVDGEESVPVLGATPDLEVAPLQAATAVGVGNDEVGPAAEPGLPEQEGVGAGQQDSAAGPEGDARQEGLDAAQQEVDAEQGVDVETQPEAGAPGLGTPPQAPAALGDLRSVLGRLVDPGLSADDVRQLVDAAKSTLRSMVGRLAQSAARALLEALNKPGADYEIGRVVGSLLSQLLVEAVLAALSAGASAAISAAKAAIQGARATSKLASVIGKLRRLLEPVLELVQKLRAAVRDLIAAVRAWLDDVLAWMRGIGRRLKNRFRRLLPGRGGAGRRGAGRAHRGHAKPAVSQARLGLAMTEAKLVSDTMEARGRSLTATLLALEVLRLQFRFVEGFRAHPKVGPVRTLYLLASEHEFDTFHAGAAKGKAGRPHRRRGPPVATPADVGEDGLTAAQRAWFRKRIDRLEPHSPAKADRLRFQRHRLSRAQKAGTLDPAEVRKFQNTQRRLENRVSGTQLRANARRGLAHEDVALRDLKLPNNNTSTAPWTHTHDGVTTRPDSFTRKASVEVKSTSDVQYRTTQIRTQQTAGRHVTVITGGPSSGVRPSGPLTDPVILQKPGGSPVVLKPRILHRDPATGGWSMWDRKLAAGGGWRPISKSSARRLVHF